MNVYFFQVPMEEVSRTREASCSWTTSVATLYLNWSVHKEETTNQRQGISVGVSSGRRTMEGFRLPNHFTESGIIGFRRILTASSVSKYCHKKNQKNYHPFHLSSLDSEKEGVSTKLGGFPRGLRQIEDFGPFESKNPGKEKKASKLERGIRVHSVPISVCSPLPPLICTWMGFLWTEIMEWII